MFELKGDRPQWEVVYDRLASMEIGDVIEDPELFGLLPDAPEGSVRGAFWRAVRQCEDQLKRTFDRVRTVGYRMVEAAEHEGLARRQHKASNRRMSAAWRKAHSADRSQLNQDQRRRIDAMEVHLSRQRELIRRIEARQEKADARLAQIEKDSLAMADKIEETTALLARHGITNEAGK